MSEIKAHEYFHRDPSKWNVLDFLNACVLEPFDIKIDEYIKSLENIFDQGQGTRKGRARALLDNYRTASQSSLLIRNKL